MPINVDEIIKALQASRQQRAVSLPEQSPLQNKLDVAKYILKTADVDWNKLSPSETIADRDTSGPSVISRIFDILSRPNYAVANAALNLTNEHSDTGLLESLWRGLAGYDKTTFADVLEQGHAARGLAPETLNPVVKNVFGLGLDIAVDPLSFLNAGAIKNAGSAIGKATGLIKPGLEAAPHSPQVLDVNKLPTDLQAVPTEPEHFNLQTTLDKIASTSDVNKPFNPEGFVPKTTDVFLDAFKTSPQASAQLAQIDKISKNMARQRFRNDVLSTSGATPEKIQMLNAWMEKNFPKARSEKYKQISEGIQGTPVTSAPMMANAIKADDLLTRAKSGDPILLEREAHREQVLSEVGNFGRSEVARAQAITDQFIQDVLSKPNKFPKVSSKAPAVGNPAQQANLAARLNNFIRVTSKTSPGAFNLFRMLRTAEDHMIEKGYNPTFWDGSNIRMTDVILELADNANDIPRVMKDHLTQVMTAFKNQDQLSVKDPLVRQAIENLRTASAVNDSAAVSKSIDEASKLAPYAESILSTPKYKEFIDKVGIESQHILDAKQASPASIKAATTAISNLLSPNATPPLKITYAKRNTIMSHMKNNERTPWYPVQRAQTLAIEESQGFKYTTVAKELSPENKAVEGVMARLATWWGQKDLRPEVLNRTMTASANAAARAKVWNQLAKQFSEDELADGFAVAQGNIPMGAATGNINTVASIFEKAFQNLFDSSGLSVAARSGMTMPDINKQLEAIGAPFRFRADKRIDPQGNIVDFSEGVEWLNSWKAFSTDKPLEFMFKLETAVEQLMQKYAFLDEVAARWGSKIRTRDFSESININLGKYDVEQTFDEWPVVTEKGQVKAASKRSDGPSGPSRLSGVYFPRDVASQLRNALSTWDQIYNPKSDLIRFFDKVTRAWKTGVTIYAPSHHIRNLIGDLYLSWMAGVNNPAVYNKARKVLFSQKERYSDLETVENLVGTNALSGALSRPGDVITKTKSGHKLTAEQIYIAAHSNGLLPHVDIFEELYGESLTKFKPFGGRLKGAATKLSENREHFTRLAHFIDLLEKSKEKDLKKLFADSAKVVRKWHPDGSDLTDFERNVLRRVLPFYSWTRKAIPLMIESALLNPGKTIAYSKMMQSFQGAMGIESPNRTDPFPLDQLFPDWIKEKGIGPIAQHGMSGLPGFIASLSRSIPGFTGDPSGYTVVNPSNPFIDTISQFGGMGNPTDPLKGIGDLVHPGIRIPLEVMQGQRFSGAPIEPGRYIAENIPITSAASRLTNIGAFGPTERAEKEGIGNLEALINFLTALGIQGTGPYIKTAEFQERDRRRKANER